MRFLLRYPITADEVKATIERIDCDSTACGDIGPLIKNGLLTFFQDPDNMTKIVEHLRVK